MYKDIDSAAISSMETKDPSLEAIHQQVDQLVAESWKKIAPFWPLSKLVAVNPLRGFEESSIEQSMIQAAAFFQYERFPELMEPINRQTKG